MSRPPRSDNPLTGGAAGTGPRDSRPPATGDRGGRPPRDGLTPRRSRPRVGGTR